MFKGVGPKIAYKLLPICRDCLKRKLGTEMLTNVKSDSVKGIASLLRELLKLVDDQTKTATILDRVIGLYLPFFEYKYDDHKKRKPDLDSLSGIIERYSNLGVFLTDLALDPIDFSQDGAFPQGQETEKMTISTIHSAKGLEWNTVFLISAVDGYLPSFQSLNDHNQIEEERRLMYVALTRAKDNLFILKPNFDHANYMHYRYSGGMQLSSVSRFLAEDNILLDYAQRCFLVADRPNQLIDVEQITAANPSDAGRYIL